MFVAAIIAITLVVHTPDEWGSFGIRTIKYF